eukprot:TRINITY_DN10386_c0_g1_i1.p1 TRINITY_DN10386_c0_g1~~TRINITY_DN10386_c0_g1_i1.p1  ORF type:complete len:540 (-),score=147.62 TRINITY_DN10386_c0_g1_i1:202-1821(-)
MNIQEEPNNNYYYKYTSDEDDNFNFDDYRNQYTDDEENYLDSSDDENDELVFKKADVVTAPPLRGGGVVSWTTTEYDSVYFEKNVLNPNKPDSIGKKIKKCKEDERCNLSFSVVYVILSFIQWFFVDYTWFYIKNNWQLLLYCIFAVIFTVMTTVYLFLTGQHMPDFPFFIFWSGAVSFTPFFFVTLAYSWFIKKEIGKLEFSVPQYKLFVIGMFTALNGVCIIYANPHVPGILQAILGPTVVTIPLGMIFSFLILKKKYHPTQLISVLIILIGLAIALYPQLFSGTDSSSSEEGSNPVGTTESGNVLINILWDFLFFFGSVPLVLYYIYEEKALIQYENLNLNWIIYWANLYQIITIIFLFPTDAIPGFGTTDFSHLFSHQYYAFQCALGYDVPTDVCSDCNCSGATLSYILFVIGYVGNTFCALGVIKYGNATFSLIVQAIVLPTSEFAFSWKFLMGPYVETLNWQNYVSLLVLLVGVVLFRVNDSSRHKKNIPEEEIKKKLIDQEIDPEEIKLHDNLITSQDGLDNSRIDSKNITL